MTIRWMSAFDDGASALAYDKFSVIAFAGGYGVLGGPDANSRFSGTKYYEQYANWTGASQGGLGKILPAAEHHARMLGACAYHVLTISGQAHTNGAAGIITLAGDGRTTRHVTLNVTNTGALRVTRGGADGTQIAISAAGVVATGWHTFQLLAVLHDTTGEVYVAMDGATVALDVNTGLDTKNAGTATTFDSVGYLGNPIGGRDSRFTDLVVATGTGTALLGDFRVKTGIADANGATQAWTGSAGGSHALLVDEATPNDDTDYVASATVGQVELFDTSLDLELDDVVKAVQTCHIVRKDDAGARSVQARIVSNSVVAEGATIAPTTGYRAITDVFETDPNTSAAFTPTAAEAVTVGIELAA